MFTKYGKTVVAVLLAVAYAIQAAITDGTVTTSEYVGIGLALLGAFGVYQAPAITNTTPNDDESRRVL